MRRLLLLSFLPALVLLVAPGCPLDIRIRCDEPGDCAQGEVCVRGGCEPVDPARVGDACGADAHCGPGLTCDLGFPGGYCQLACSATSPCPAGSVCATELGQCLRACGEACARPGYGCGPVPDASIPPSACVPVTTQADGGCTGEACEVPDGGCTGAECEVPDAGCTGAGCETPDGGCSGPGCGPPDAGCASTVEVGGACTRPCECADAEAACVGGMCTLTCSTDFTCRDGRRCTDGQCVVGPRIGESCGNTFECPTFAHCPPERMRCEAQCNPGSSLCEAGYQCAPDGLCVQACAGDPVSVGALCENSLDCAPCSVCVSTGAAKRCRKPCQLDRDCPGGAPGACQQVGDTRACWL